MFLRRWEIFSKIAKICIADRFLTLAGINRSWSLQLVDEAARKGINGFFISFFFSKKKKKRQRSNEFLETKKSQSLSSIIALLSFLPFTQVLAISLKDLISSSSSLSGRADSTKFPYSHDIRRHRPSLLTGSLNGVQCPRRANVCRSLLRQPTQACLCIGVHIKMSPFTFPAVPSLSCSSRMVYEMGGKWWYSHRLLIVWKSDLSLKK